MTPWTVCVIPVNVTFASIPRSKFEEVSVPPRLSPGPPAAAPHLQQLIGVRRQRVRSKRRHVLIREVTVPSK
jgi:hypothetical protein